MPANRISKGIRRKARHKPQTADAQVGGFVSPRLQRDGVSQLHSTIGNQAAPALLSPNERPALVQKSAREMAEGFATKGVHENIPEKYDIDVTIPVPFTNDIHVQESIHVREWVMGKAKPMVNDAITAVITEERVVGLMDGACAVADMGEEPAAP